MPPSLPAYRSMLLSSYAYDLGVPLAEFLVRLRLCSADEARAHVLAGEFRLDGKVLDDPSRLIRTQDLRAGVVAELLAQRVTLSFWSEEDPPSPPPPPKRSLLYVSALERWTQYNEYEGACKATWNGREHWFHVDLVGDEWDRVRVGATWEADVYFECMSPVEVLDDSPSLTAELKPLSGVNHLVCGRILRQVEDGILVAAPRTVVVDLDLSRCVGSPIKPGRWLRSRGTLEARIPDQDEDAAAPKP